MTIIEVTGRSDLLLTPLFYNRDRLIERPNRSFLSKTYSLFCQISKNEKINFIMEHSEMVIATYEKMAIVRFDLRHLPNRNWLKSRVAEKEYQDFLKTLTPEDHFYKEYDLFQDKLVNLCIMKISALSKLDAFPMLKRTATIK